VRVSYGSPTRGEKPTPRLWPFLNAFDTEAKKYNVYPLDSSIASRADPALRPSLTRGRSEFEDNTTITLENEFWEQLRIIAVTRNTAISQLLAEIDRTMRLQRPRPGRHRVRTLSAAVRVFVLQTLISPPSSGKRRVRPDLRGRCPEECIPSRRPGEQHPERASRAGGAVVSTLPCDGP
jgi:predicted DNA-binding ribbon-helix-helix protein